MVSVIVGFKKPTICILLSLFIAGTSYSQQLLRVVTLSGKVRDQKEWKDFILSEPYAVKNLIPGGNPDFENTMGWGCEGAVEKRINTADITSAFPYDNRGPKLIGQGCGDMFAGPNYFRVWFNDTTAYDTISVRPFLVPLRFNFYSDCRMVFQDSVFFPIDSSDEMHALTDPAKPTFGYLQSYGPSHNYGFTLEFHSVFSYIKGTHQKFAFTGDDDVWVFVNDSLVIDLGGLHEAQSDSVDLDQLPTGFLADGRQYILDFFAAERHSTESNIRITTSIILEDEGTVADTIVMCSGKPMALPPMTFPPKWYVNWHTPPISGRVTGSDGMPIAGTIITLVLSNGGGTVQTDSWGNYSVNVPRHWSGTVTPQAPNFVFAPVKTTVTNDTAALRLNFTGVDTTKNVTIRAALLIAPRSLDVRPIVSRNGVDFQVAVEKSSSYELVVYDVSGRAVWQYAASHAAPGYHHASWPSSGSAGRPGGIFFVKLTRGSERIATAFTVIR